MDRSGLGARRREQEGEDSSINSNSESSSVDGHPSKRMRENTTQLPRKRLKQKYEAKNEAASGMTGAYTGEIYKSNSFKLQVDELLSTLRPQFPRIERAITDLLQTAKSIVESIPGRQSLSIVDADKHIQSEYKISVPLPDGRALVGDNYSIYFKKPAQVNVVGSYPMRTVTWSSDILEIDLVVTMPDSILQEKDYINHRYFTRRAYYLAYLASAFKADISHRFKATFDYWHGNPYLPILMLEPSIGASEAHSRVWSRCRICVLPVPSSGFFDMQKLAPYKNCVRNKSVNTVKDAKALATPFYNASVLQDMLVVSYLKLQHEAGRQCEQYKDACSLGRTWLRQRGFSSKISSGGFGNAEWAILVALLLQGGGNKGLPLFSQGYSGYQLFKATLQYLSNKDFVKAPHMIGTSRDTIALSTLAGPVVFDIAHCHNILYRMTVPSYRKLRYEAETTIKALNDTCSDSFESTFIHRNDMTQCQFDAVVELPIQAILRLEDSAPSKRSKVSNSVARLHDVISKALGTRTKLLDCSMPHTNAWPIEKIAKTVRQAEKITIGVVFDEVQINRLVDHGPSAESKEAAEKFVEFWGSKAELRRFKDGRILESVVWSVEAGGPTVFRQIISYILEKHFGPQFQTACKVFENTVQESMPELKILTSDRTGFQSAIEGFLELETALRSIEDIPLRVSQVLAADSQLSFSSVTNPGNTTSEKSSRPAQGIIELEGSARWPDDMDAVQKTKLAFLLQLANVLEKHEYGGECRVGLENTSIASLNQGYLDVRNQTGIVYRLRIRHDREVTLLEKQLKDKSVTQQEKFEVSKALATHKQQFIRHTAHCQAIRALALRHPSFSQSVRLVKYWFSSHLLSPYLAEQLIEMFVAKVYTSPYPWQAPSSPVPALLRTILLLDRWDWHTKPWIVNLSAEQMVDSDIQNIQTRFEAWRKIDPAMNRVVLFAASSVDHDGTTWTDHGRPIKVVAARMTAIARAAATIIKDQGIALSVKSLFQSSLNAYDFTLHMNRHAVYDTDKKAKPNGHAFKNMELQANADGFANSGYDPFLAFVNEVQTLYSHALILFYSNEKRDVVAGLWNPQTNRAWKLRLGYSSMPAGAKSHLTDDAADGESADASRDEVKVNRHAILNEIARLGGTLIAQIKQK